MGIPQYTTPTIVIPVKGVDLTQMAHVAVTFESKDYMLTKNDGELTIEPNSISVSLTQEETSHMSIGFVRVQANWTDTNGNRSASDIVQYVITDQLLKSVME